MSAEGIELVGGICYIPGMANQCSWEMVLARAMPRLEQNYLVLPSALLSVGCESARLLVSTFESRRGA